MQNNVAALPWYATQVLGLDRGCTHSSGTGLPGGPCTCIFICKSAIARYVGLTAAEYDTLPS